MTTRVVCNVGFVEFKLSDEDLAKLDHQVRDLVHAVEPLQAVALAKLSVEERRALVLGQIARRRLESMRVGDE